jgi:cytochrome c-type biogenesis protein
MNQVFEGAPRWMRAALLTLVGVVAAWSWLIVVAKWGPANRIDILTFKAGMTSSIMRTLLRQGQGSGRHDHASGMISGVYATPTYYAMTEQTREADQYLPDRYAVFYLFEDVHVGALGRTPPTATLRLGDGTVLAPVDREVLRDSFHHRATVVRFAKNGAGGRPLIDEATTSLTLVARSGDAAGGPARAGAETTLVPAPGTHAAHAAVLGGAQASTGSPGDRLMRWDLPIVYPTDLNDGSDLSFATMVALLAGLLAVLSPCLLQLTVYYTFALAGLSLPAESTATDVVGQSGARARVMRTAVAFIAGFTVVFTLAGAIAGFAGERLQMSGLMASWNRPLGIAAGLGILLLGVWVGANAGPSLCRLPAFAVRHSGSRWSDLKAMFLGSAFAIGCSTCFGGALFISLMIYVGAAGSAWLGALSLFLFSLGIAVPYLLAAFFLSRALPLLGAMQRVASGVGMVCAVALVFFGVILITDSFHIPSDYLYRLLLES